MHEFQKGISSRPPYIISVDNMELIAQNPYRVLGMFANDSLKVMTANIAKIRAFAKVGKECSFESDYTEIFGTIDRSESAIETAISQLSSEDISLYTSLWLHKTSTLDSYLTDISDILRSQLKDDSVDAVFNVMLCSLWSQHKELCVEYTMKLFSMASTLEDHTKMQILKYAECHYAEQTGWGNNYLSFWPSYERLCNEESINSDLSRFIYNAYHNLAKEEVISMAKAISEHKAELFWSLPYWVEKNIQNVVHILHSTTKQKNEDLDAQSQLALNKLGSSIFHAGKEYHAANVMWKAKDGQNLLDSLRKAYRFIYDSKLKEELTNFGKIVKSQIKYLAPNEVITPTLKIKKAINNFCDKTEKVSFALLLIKECVNPLIEILNILGSENVYYRRISTQIADNAIYSADVDLSAAVRIFNNPTNDTKAAKVHLQRVVDQCRLLACNIEQYNLEEEFLLGKLHSFIQYIKRVSGQYDLEENVVNPDIVISSDYDLFMACGSDYAKLVEYVQSNKDSRYIGQAMQKIWEIEDQSWPNEDNAKNILLYKQRFPNSHNEQRVLEILDRLLLRSNIGTPFEYRMLRRLYPNHPKKDRILLLLEISVYNRCSKIKDYYNYIQEYPSGRFVKWAKDKINELKNGEQQQLFHKCRTIADYNRFILKYPTSNLFGAACAKIEDLAYANAQSTGNYDDYLNQYPKGRYSNTAKKQKEYIFCQKVLKDKTFSKYYSFYPNGAYTSQVKAAEEEQRFKDCKRISDYYRYLKDYPNGKYKKTAKATIKRYWIKVILVIACVPIIIFVSCSMLFKNNQNEVIHPLPLPDDTSIVSQENYEASDSENYFEETVEDYSNNSLPTGSRPYRSHYGKSLSGAHEFTVKTSSDCDYVILIKRHKDGKYVDHKYVCGGDIVTISVPDGTYDIYFYSGNGWNPNKQVGACTGGFMSNESVQKDGPITMETTYEGDYYYNQSCIYTLYPVIYGNLHLESSNKNEAFN